MGRNVEDENGDVSKSVTCLETSVDQLGGRVGARLEDTLELSRVAMDERVSTKAARRIDYSRNETADIFSSRLDDLTILVDGLD